MLRVILFTLFAITLLSCQSNEKRNVSNTKGNKELERQFKNLSKKAYQDSVIFFDLDTQTTFEWDSALIITPYSPIEILEKKTKIKLDLLNYTKIDVTEGYSVIAFVKSNKLIDFLELNNRYGAFESFEGTRVYSSGHSKFKMFKSDKIFSDSVEILNIQPLDKNRNLILWNNTM